MTNTSVISKIDHTLLKPEATRADIITLAEEAKQYKFASVCVNPFWVSTAAEVLKGTEVKVCTVIGFPLGASASEVKAFEVKKAIEDGATEVDMVINVGALKAGELEIVTNDMVQVVEAAKGKALVKVILETCLLTPEEIVTACKCVRAVC